MDYIEEKTFGGGTKIRLFNNKVPKEKAQLAIDLLKHLAIVAGDVDGEDTAGRSKLRLLKPQEVAERAVAIAAEAWIAFEAEGWVLDVPAPKAGVRCDTDSDED